MKEYQQPIIKDIDVILTDIIAISNGDSYDDGETWGELHS